MTEPGPIRARFNYSDLPRHSPGAPLRSNQQPWVFLANLLIFFMYFVPAAAIVDAVTSPPASSTYRPTLFLPGLGVGLACGLLLYFCLRRLLRMALVQHHDAIAAAPSRRDGTEVLLDSRAITLTGTGVLWKTAWAGIIAVEELDEFTLLRPSEVEYLPIPHASLPPGVTPDDLRAAIAHWRAA